MKSPFLPVVAGLVIVVLPVKAQESTESSPSPNPAGPVPSEARLQALESMRAYAKEGFRIRDGEWSVELSKGDSRFLQVTLFAGERYLFAAASPRHGIKLRLTFFDASGKEVKSTSPKGVNTAAGNEVTGIVAEIAPEKSGNYFVGVELAESPVTGPCEMTLVYAYK